VSELSPAADDSLPRERGPASVVDNSVVDNSVVDNTLVDNTVTDSAPTTVDVTRLRVAIARLSRRLRKHELAGLTPTQLAALSTVEQAGPLRLGDLAAAERVAPSTLTRLVSALEEHGYVKRRAVPGDARAWELAVTARGREVLERIRQESTTMLAENLLMLSPDQLAALAAALPALEQLADTAPHPARQVAPGR
jgi:DNA-binding MarR family transcriptional regulator